MLPCKGVKLEWIIRTPKKHIPPPLGNTLAKLLVPLGTTTKDIPPTLVIHPHMTIMAAVASLHLEEAVTIMMTVDMIAATAMIVIMIDILPLLHPTTVMIAPPMIEHPLPMNMDAARIDK